MGLQMNAAKTEAMVSTPVVKATKIREGAYRRKLRGTGPEYVDRSRMPMQCPIAGCNSVLQKRSLASHMRNQHPGVLPPRLELEDSVSGETYEAGIRGGFVGRKVCLSGD